MTGAGLLGPASNDIQHVDLLELGKTLTDHSAVLVTGGAGYIGAHCCKALSEAGFTPVCLDNLSTGHRDFVKWGPLIEGDIADRALVRQVIADQRIVAVLHFAALSLVGESVADPEKYYTNNLAGTLSLLAGMREAGCDKIVFSSTGAVYGNLGLALAVESAAGHPVNPYGMSKWTIERVLADYHRAYDFKSVCLRYFNASGADSECDIGEYRDVETHLIPRALMALQGMIGDLAIFGEDYDTPDGTAIRDYIHVTDLAAAHVMAVRRLLGGSACGTFNLGTGRGYSVRQVLDAIARETGQRVQVEIKPRRAGDPSQLVADIAAARRDFGFETQCSDLMTIIKTAWAWHKKVYATRYG